MHSERVPSIEPPGRAPAEEAAKHGDAPALPPSLRRTLDRLLLGESEKQIAEKLGISRHTVHGYIKQLYARLGVHSRAELMARWIAGAKSRSR